MQSADELAAPHAEFYHSLFRQINPYASDETDAATIAAFLKTARGVNVTQLSQIWEISSELSGCKNRGALNRLGVFMCFKFVAAIQQGLSLSPNVLGAQLAPPHFASAPPPPPPGGAGFPSKSPSICSKLGGQQEPGWAIGAAEQRKYDAIFDSLGPVAGKLGGDQCRVVLLNSQLPKAQLAKIWDLADMDADGFLDRPEFCVAMHLVYKALQSEPIPEQLPTALVPFSKRASMRRMSTRSVEPMSHPHPPPLSWSSRASSLASLHYQPSPISPPPMAPPPQVGHHTALPPQRRKSSAAAAAGAGLSLFERNVEEWRVENLGQYESEFQRLDADRDGLVSGADIREVFLRTGLPQHTRARIWAHVDVAKTGMLNVEQYAKCVELIRECQAADVVPPAPHSADQSGAGGGTVSPPLPPSMLARRDSQISTGTLNSSSGAKAAVAENQRVVELNAQIEEMQQGRRKAEQDLFQAEADLKVKNSEIRNLEIELLTLNATVKQLKSQRVEATKRLGDLDTRITKLEGVCTDNQRRLGEDEERLAKTRADIQSAKENSQAEEQVLETLRAEVQRRREHTQRAKQALADQNAAFEGFVDELTRMERGMVKNEEECARMRDQMAQMERILEAVDKADEQAKKELLQNTFDRTSDGRAKASFGGQQQQQSKEDPFASTGAADPFGGGGGTAAAAAAPDDPFGEKAPASATSASANFANFAAFS